MTRQTKLKWGTLLFCGALTIALVISCIWTSRYWVGGSMMAEGLRAQHGYLGGLAHILGEGSIPLLSRLKLALFVAAPIISGLMALCSLSLALLQLSGRRVWPFAATLAVLSLFGTWAGMRALREVEDPIFFSHSPWVSAFKSNAYPVAGLAGLYLLGLGYILFVTRSAQGRTQLGQLGDETTA